MKKYNHMWQRVQATNPPMEESRRRRANKATFESLIFKEACKLAKIDRTPRQASRWNNNRGLAMRYNKQATRIVGGR